MVLVVKIAFVYLLKDELELQKQNQTAPVYGPFSFIFGVQLMSMRFSELTYKHCKPFLAVNVDLFSI